MTGAGMGKERATGHGPQHAREEDVRVLACTPLTGEALAALEAVATVETAPAMGEEALLQRIANYNALIVGPKMRVTADVIKYGFKLRAIGCLCSYLDNVDVSTARALGVTVVNAPGGNAVAIAEQTLTRLLELSQRFGDGRLAGKTLGLIGFGRVAREVARRAAAFDMRVLTNQPRLTPELALAVGVTVVDLPDLLRESDFVSLHLPVTRETETIVGAEELAQMREGAFLLNMGHTELVDNAAIYEALEAGQLAGAAITVYPVDEEGTLSPHAARLQAHPRVLVAPHVTTILADRREDVALEVAGKVADILHSREASETLALELVPAEMVMPHEQIDDKRVARLTGRLEEDGRLVNPPIAIAWEGRYIILDGATRYTAMTRMGFPHLIVQVVQPDDPYELHTWYHAINSDLPLEDFLDQAAEIEGLKLAPLAPAAIPEVFQQEETLCYFLDRSGRATLAKVAVGASRHEVLNELVARYTAWGQVERTLLTSLSRLVAQFPRLSGVAIYPQFKPETVFNVARRGDLLPAGLTRFVIPGRILRLNADLERLRADEPLAAKRAWFNRFLQEKMARSRLRYYEEPVLLLDE